ncbi:MAG: M48 family metallopeptidase [Planctomycetota bacterium]
MLLALGAVDPVTATFLALLAISVGLRMWLAERQVRYVRTHAGRVPEPFAGRVSLEAHDKAARYTVAGTRFGQLALGVRSAILLLWTLGGGLQLWDGAAGSLGWEPLSMGLVFVVGFFALQALLGLPLSAWRTFVLEERFGFNRTKPGLFVADFLKELVLLAVLATPLVLLALWLMRSIAFWWWLPVWGAWIVFQLLVTWAYPAFILPWFNKLEPLEEGELRERLEDLVARTGFSSQGVFVMDGSRRSAHSNAFFSGIGNKKRIVLFDTLMETLSAGQMEAVLAHELGHFRLRHVPKMLMLNAVGSAVALAGLALVADRAAFYTGLGVQTMSVHAALVLFFLVTPLIGVLLQPLFVGMMRRYEFEADAFAGKHAQASDLVGALVRLNIDNASTLTPDPLYSAYHYTHPPPAQRVARLEASAPA